MMDAATARSRYCNKLIMHPLPPEDEEKALRMLKVPGFYAPEDPKFREAAAKTAYYGTVPLVDALLKLGGTITASQGEYEARGSSKGNLIHIAADAQNASVLETLLCHATPDEVNAKNQYGAPPVLLAARNHTGNSFLPTSDAYLNSARCLNALLDAGADVNVRNSLQDNILSTMLFGACIPDMRAFRTTLHGTHDLEELLQNKDADIKGTPLMLAMGNFPWSYVKAMIHEGADATAATDNKPGAYPSRLPRKYLSGNRKMLAKYCNQYSATATEIAALPLPAMLKRLTGEDGFASHELRAMLSLNVADPLVSPDTWRNKPGGMEAGQEFARQLEMLIPENRSALKGRLDLLPYRRETETPREDSVLVSYLRNTLPPRELS